MAKTNYSYEKRQRDLAKKKKKEEKRLKKQSRTAGPEEVSAEENAEAPTSAAEAGELDTAVDERQTDE